MSNFVKAFYAGVVAVMLTLVAQQSAFAQPLWVSCKPVETAVYSERVHVRCVDPVDNRFRFFASPTTDSKAVARTLSIIESAQLGDKFLNVLIDPSDQTGAGFGCLVSDCRRIIAISMVEAPLATPSTCAFDTNRPGCPGYCAAHPNDKGCPAYCSTHPDDPDCPGYCTRHPTDAVNCDPGDGRPKVCKTKPYLPQCKL